MFCKPAGLFEPTNLYLLQVNHVYFVTIFQVQNGLNAWKLFLYRVAINTIVHGILLRVNEIV